MILLALAVSLQAIAGPSAPAEDFVIINSLSLRAPDLSEKEFEVANRYASCISLPYFPLPDEFTAKQNKCRKRHKLRDEDEQLRRAFDALDRTIQEYPGSEASLEVSRKTNAQD